MALHNISIKPKDPEKPLSGLNCLVTIDDVPIGGITKLSFELVPSSIGKIAIELVGDINIEGTIETDFK